MIKVLYVPLDERACNYKFPQKLAALTEDIELLVPPVELMGFKKKPADFTAIWQWLFENASSCDYAILSVDTLVYGNIINSRTHHRSIGECKDTLELFRRLKEINPHLHIHAFNLAARVAAYNSANEDPDYWEKNGKDIWRYSYLMDKCERGHANTEEKKEKEALELSIPTEYLQDFLQRRVVDRFTNLYCVDLVESYVFDMLTVPKDDTAEYGFAAMDQSAISQAVQQKRLMSRVLVYPGADEVGCVLLVRVINLIHGYTPKVYVRFSSVLGPQIVPLYEDRPLLESIKAQINSLGGIYVDTPQESDCMLAVNSPGKFMIESADQYTKDITFSSHINMHEFLRYIGYYAKRYIKPVGIAEVSVANGCENEFMEYALLSGTLHQVQAVGGWNTSQNTIGVVLAETVIAAYYNSFVHSFEKYRALEENKLRNIICDWLYQSNVLHTFIREHHEQINPYALGDSYSFVVTYFEAMLRQTIAEKFGYSYKGSKIELKNLHFHWDGVFYIDFDVSLPGLQVLQTHQK